MKFLGFLFLMVICFSVLNYAQSDDWNITGQIQLRSELDGRDFSNETHPLTFTSLRSRLGVEKAFDKLNFFVQVQDSRVFGEEGTTLSSISNLDLHQGYVTLSDIFETSLSLQAGRFEMVYGTERFFGSVGWHYVGRAWDGARLRIKSGFNLDVFALTQSETQGYIGNAVPGIYPDPGVNVPSSSIYGFWTSFYASKEHQFDPFYFYDVNRAKVSGELVLARHTAGINYFFKSNPFAATMEGAYQFGTMGTADIAAYLFSLQLMLNQNNSKFGAGADLLSGDNSELGTYGSFAASYGTNHKFYGFMDYFINIPGNTTELGLHDLYLFGSLTPSESKFSGSLWIHHFMANQERADENTFGQEIDLTIGYNFMKGTTLSWGGSIFLPGDLMKTRFRTIKGVREDPSFWSYLMITANI